METKPKNPTGPNIIYIRCRWRSPAYAPHPRNIIRSHEKRLTVAMPLIKNKPHKGARGPEPKHWRGPSTIKSFCCARKEPQLMAIIRIRVHGDQTTTLERSQYHIQLQVHGDPNQNTGEVPANLTAVREDPSWCPLPRNDDQSHGEGIRRSYVFPE